MSLTRYSVSEERPKGFFLVTLSRVVSVELAAHYKTICGNQMFKTSLANNT